MKNRKSFGAFLGALAAAAALWAPAWALRPAMAQPARVVIDAGHGGFDGGAEGVGGVHEARLNLELAQKLQRELEQRGVEVVMTRTEDQALGSTKMEDMRARKSCIEQSGAQLCISIHMNTNPEEDCMGVTCIYCPDSKNGEQLAQQLTEQLQQQMTSTKIRPPYADSLYLLRAQGVPAVLVECGFLSNAQEETRLCDPAYQRMLARAIADGVMEYYGEVHGLQPAQQGE